MKFLCVPSYGLLLRTLIGFVFVLVGGRMLARKEINKLLYNLYISSMYISLSGHTEHAYNLFLSPRYHMHMLYMPSYLLYNFPPYFTFTGPRSIYPPAIYLPTLRRCLLAAFNSVHHPDSLLAQREPRRHAQLARRFVKAPASNPTIDCYFVQYASVF